MSSFLTNIDKVSVILGPPYLQIACVLGKSIFVVFLNNSALFVFCLCVNFHIILYIVLPFTIVMLILIIGPSDVHLLYKSIEFNMIK